MKEFTLETIGGPNNNYSFQNKINEESKNVKNNSIKKTHSFQFENDFLNDLQLINKEPVDFASTMPIMNFQIKEHLSEPEKMIIEFFKKTNKTLNESTFLTKKEVSILNSSILSGSSTISNQFLETRELKNISNQELENFINHELNPDSLISLENVIKNRFNNNNLSLFLPENPINPFGSLVQLIEQSFCNVPNPVPKMKKNYEKCKNFVFKFRKIKPDGNCFYRAVIIRYLELIILSQDLNLFKNVFWDLKSCFEDNLISSLLRVNMNYTIKPLLINKIFALIYLKLKNNEFKNAYFLFIGSLLFCPIFDYGLILYFRYILFKYIQKNENKFYSKNFNILIGNLLPAKYETEDSKFLFDKFYNEYLLKMFQDAEKIIIYLTPFVLCVKLKIIIFEDESDEFIKEFNFEGKNYNNNNNINDIFLINKKNHYDLLFSKNDFKKYENFFKIFVYQNFQPRIFRIKEEEEDENNKNINSESIKQNF